MGVITDAPIFRDGEWLGQSSTMLDIPICTHHHLRFRLIFPTVPFSGGWTCTP